MAIFLLFSQNFSENFGQHVRVINQSKKLVQYLLSIFRFHGLIFRSQISKNFWYREKMSSQFVYVPTVRNFSSTELSKNFGCRENYSSTSPKSQQSGHLNRPLFRQSALSPVCCIVCRPFRPIAHFRQENCVKRFGQFGTLKTFG